MDAWSLGIVIALVLLLVLLLRWTGRAIERDEATWNELARGIIADAFVIPLPLPWPFYGENPIPPAPDVQTVIIFGDGQRVAVVGDMLGDCPSGAAVVVAMNRLGYYRVLPLGT